jgi:pimeloyl-ACP methyl ester carboxylesterase
MNNLFSKTIVFITGAFVSNSCWDDWCIFFEEKGYKTIAPPWPTKDGTANDLRQTQPNPCIAALRLESLTDYFADIARKLPEKPILIGHSMGGLITQILLQQELAIAGIAIHSLQPLGVFTFKFSFYKAGWGPLGFFTPTKKSFLMSFIQWQYAFTNGMSYEEQKEGYYKYLIPESKLVVRDAISKAAKVDFKKPHAPLLFVSGSADNFIPASLNYSNYKKYSHPNSITDYKDFKGRNHFVLGQPTWKEDAAFIANWIAKLSVEQRGL